MTNTLQAVIRHTYTATVEFIGTPSLEQRKAVSTAGFKYNQGRWVKHQAESRVVDATEAVTLVTAA